MNEELLRVNHLKKYFPINSSAFGKSTGAVHAVDDISLIIHRGETLGLVGESGSGKSTLGKTVLRLYPKTEGEVLYRGRDVFALKRKELRQLRPKMQYIFQDPYSSLDPRMRIGDAIAEPLLQHGLAEKGNVREKVEQALVTCGLAASNAGRFPHQFSGGQRQRAVIARAVVMNPDFIVADEPVSALDVSIQAQIINLFSDLQERYELSYLFISHDLSIVEHLCTRTAIMYLGRIVETAPNDEIFSHPLHPYTQALLSAIPVPDPTRKKSRIILQGDIPSPSNPPAGCRFHTRCPFAKQICRENAPELRDMGSGHCVACHLANES
jgi:peptide/nickel transport system ATP-binding protein